MTVPYIFGNQTGAIALSELDANFTALTNGTQNIAFASVSTTEPIATASTTGAYSYGTLTYTDTNLVFSLQANVNSYFQHVMQNSNAGTIASTDMIVSNNLGTANTYYGNFGINSSGFTGTGSFNLPNATYLTSTSGDLVIGSTTANNIRFVVNSAATDTLDINGTTGVATYLPTIPPTDNSAQLATTAYVTTAVSNVTSTTITGRNVIVNGDCSISQVNGGSLITPINGQFIIDMWSYNASQPAKINTFQSTSRLNSLGAAASLSFQVLSLYTALSTEAFYSGRSIEGFNFARFQYGTANAKAGSLQFKVNAPVAGTYSGAIWNGTGTRSYPFTFTVAALTDTLIQLPNIPGDTSGTWVGSTSGVGAIIIFDLGSGTNYKSSAGSWQSGTYTGVTGTTNLVSQVNGSTLTITDVQFEVGSVCTQFERKLYDQNYRESQRYLRPLAQPGCTGQAVSTTQALNFSVGTPMRATPSYILVSTLQVLAAIGGAINVTGTVVNQIAVDGTIYFTNTVAAGLVAGNAVITAGGAGFFSSQI